MKRLILLAILIIAATGAFMAVRWFRGDTDYEDALDQFDEETAAVSEPAASS